MIVNAAGQIVEKCWKDIPAHFPHVKLDEFVIMPNHVHGILSIVESVGAKNFSPLPQHQRPGTSKTIGSIIRGFKTGVTKWMRANTEIHNVWQRNFYEHIIRDESSLHRIREYIVNNPARWADDPENPENVGANHVNVRTMQDPTNADTNARGVTHDKAMPVGAKNVNIRTMQDPTNADTPTRGMPYGNVMSVGAKNFSPLPRWDGKRQ